MNHSILSAPSNRVQRKKRIKRVLRLLASFKQNVKKKFLFGWSHVIPFLIRQHAAEEHKSRPFLDAKDLLFVTATLAWFPAPGKYDTPLLPAET